MTRTPETGADDDDDGALFRAAIGPVRALPPTPEPPRPSPPRPSTRMAERDDAEARSAFRQLLDGPLLEAGDTMQYRRDEVPARVLRRLGRGEYSAQEELDLHHSDAEQATALLRLFLRDAADAGLGCVRIVHGKGLNSASGAPILKNLVDRLLRQRSDVLAFHSAPAAQGSTGAVLVLLRPRSRLG
ncbi:Smr/MutS family protein [Luteimonas deserti]|uniref:Smr/MutS family protein n=1 Tax=Luteimonas deserti TaxID=2752306 RepID=A0A7Z0QRW8_9GAMM|nr:Smr/MutS family protein [Luteimonas deserti]NYZ63014.1 Smr/MutS family protein [Luteimonas deserti]